VNERISEIIFEVTEDEADGGYNASALGYSNHTQADNLDELRELVRDALQLHFSEQQPPGIIRLHFVRDELLAL
jgi:predicted RNase H-like HicB family nuclease